jgi:hypothetical protein
MISGALAAGAPGADPDDAAALREAAQDYADVSGVIEVLVGTESGRIYEITTVLEGSRLRGKLRAAFEYGVPVSIDPPGR